MPSTRAALAAAITSAREAYEQTGQQGVHVKERTLAVDAHKVVERAGVGACGAERDEHGVEVLVAHDGLLGSIAVQKLVKVDLDERCELVEPWRVGRDVLAATTELDDARVRGRRERAREHAATAQTATQHQIRKGTEA